MSAAGCEEREMRNMAEPAKRNRGCCRKHPVLCCSLLLVTMLSSLVAAGLLLGFREKVNDKVDTLIAQHVHLTPNSTATDQWKNSSAPLYSRYYFYNITNPAEVANGQPPHLAELGPFVFRENRTKFGLNWTDDDNVVEYSLDVNYTWDEALSWGDPKATHVTTINIPLIGVSQEIIALENDPENSWLKKEVIKALVKVIDDIKKESGWEGLFTSRTVDELLWGYEDPLLKFLKEANLVGTSTFGYNNKSELETPNSVFTGKNDSSLVGQYIMWKGHHTIDGWGSPTAQMINGTGGYIFHPKVSRKENLVAFISELYRSGYFTYQEDITLHGIKLYKFALPAEELVNTTQDPGFYANGPSGVLNLTAVTPNALPFFMSKPHFLDAYTGYLANVSGLVPRREIHDSYLAVEPLTGAVLSAAKRIQLNLHLLRYKDIPELAKLSADLMLPIFWASEEGNITASLANDFKSAVYTVEYGVSGGVLAAIVLAGVVCVVSALCMAGLVVQQCRYGSLSRRAQRPGIPTDEFSPLLSAGSTNRSPTDL